MDTPGNWLDRTELLLGRENCDRLARARVLVVGLGGVGAVAAEMLCRAGIGRLTLVDGDRIAATNLNRQLPALVATLGQYKTEVVGKRLKAIHPGLDLEIHTAFLAGEDIAALLDRGRFDCVLDAIDTVGPKLQLASACVERGLPLVSSMGAAARLDPEQVRCADISQTHDCPLAKAFRHGLAKLGIRSGIRAVFSAEPPVRSAFRHPSDGNRKKTTVGTISFMPAVFGCHCAGAVIRSLLDSSPPFTAPPSPP